MFLQDTDSNYTWVEPIKNRAEGKIIMVHTQALNCMKLCGITPKHKVLDNEAPGAYKGVVCL